MKTYIVTISDTHTQHNDIDVPDGDIIIHAGDFSYKGRKLEIDDFLDWYGSLPHKNKILIAGNHDKGTDRDQKADQYQGLPDYFEKRCSELGIILLNDSLCVVKANDGTTIKIWGSPVQPTFGFGWAWNRNRGDDIKKHWDKIPKDVDIVVTHGPPLSFGDKVIFGNTNVGCSDLLRTLYQTNVKMHVFGHIHEDRGVGRFHGITFVNASSLNLHYNPYKDKTFRFDWDKIKNMTSQGRDYD